MQRLFILSLLILSFAFPFEANAQTVFPNRGGTGATTTPAYGDILVGNATGTFSVRSTSSLGISAGGTGPATSTNPLMVTYVVATGSATSSASNFSISTAVSFLGDYITNVTTWVRGKIDAYLSGGDGITYSSGAISFDCSEVEGTGINCSANDVTLDATGDWTGTFDGAEGSAYLANSFSTTSADAWKNTRNFFSTSSTAYWETTQTARTADDLSDNTTSDLAEGSRLYWTNTRFDARLAASSTIPTITTLLGLTSVGTITTGTWQGTPIADAYLTKTGAWSGTFDGLEGTAYLARANHTGTQAASTVTGGTFGSGTFVFPSGSLVGLGSSTLQSFRADRGTTTNATSTNLAVSGDLWLNGERFTDLTGTGLQNSSGALSIDATGNWTGTFDGQEGSYYLANSFSTTSASYFLSQNQGAAFSTTSANYWETQQTARTADDLTNNSIEDLNDVAAMTENYGDLLFWNGSSWADKATNTLNISWNHLADMPAGFADGIDNTGGAPSWGTITGTLSDQTDLQAALNLKLDRSASSSLPNLGTFGSSSATTTAAGNLAVSGDVAADQLFATGATSTLASGLNLLTGCIAYNGTCLSTGGGSQTPWTSNIDGGGYNLTNAGSITAATIHTTSTAATSTGAGPWRLVANGAYGGWGSTDGGLLNLRMEANPGAALNIVTDADDTSSDSPLLYVEATNSGYENQLLRLIHASGCGNCAQIRMDSPAPQIEWVETDQVGTNGSGKFEMQVNGNQFNIAPRLFDNSGFQNAYEFAHAWHNPSTLLTISASTTSATMNAIKIANTISSAGAQPGIAWSNTPGSITSARISSASGSGHANSILAFEVADASKALLERARFDVNGDFGIGTTSPWGRLSVKGTSTDPAFVVASSTGSIMLKVDYTGTTTASNGINLTSGCFAIAGTCLSAGGGSGTVNSGTQGQTAYYAGNGTAVSGTSSLYIATTGFVGVGDTTPDNELTVAGDDPRIELNDTGGSGGEINFGINFGGGFLTTESNHPFAIWTNGGQRLTITETGRVGVGTSTPQTEEHVVGTSTISNSAGSSGLRIIPSTSASGTTTLDFF